MRWRQFLTPVENMDSEEVRSYIDKHEAGTYTLLDVRQPSEYEKERIPGAILIPLPELAERAKEIEDDKPVITYCAVGGRSRAGAQILSGKGFDEVYNLKGGIKAWNGRTAYGPAETGMTFLKGDETAGDVIIIAYGMEEGLRGFYRELFDTISDKEASDLLRRLSEIEERHKERLFDKYLELDSSVADREVFEKEISPDIMEGGFTAKEFIEKNSEMTKSVPDILSLAMMLEAQALDLYMRYSVSLKDKGTRRLLFDIAEEEKAHLVSLGRLMGKNA